MNWITDREPSIEIESVLVTLTTGEVKAVCPVSYKGKLVFYGEPITNSIIRKEDVVAWAELPEPYE